MKEFAIILLGIIFVTLIASSVQSISADHLEPGKGIFKNEIKRILFQAEIQNMRYMY